MSANKTIYRHKIELNLRTTTDSELTDTCSTLSGVAFDLHRQLRFTRIMGHWIAHDSSILYYVIVNVCSIASTNGPYGDLDICMRSHYGIYLSVKCSLASLSPI